MHSFRGESCTKKLCLRSWRASVSGAFCFRQNRFQCWDHVCHKRHPSSIFGALVFHAKNVSMLRRCLHSWGMGASRFSQNWATLRQSHARSIIKIVDLHFTFQSTRLFSNETTEIPALAPCKMEVTLMIYVDCKSLNMSEWWPHSKARARPRDHVWRLINALGCNSTNLMRFSSLCPTSRSIPLRLLPKEQRPLDPPWPGATSQAQKRWRTSGWSVYKWILRCLRHKTSGCLDYLQILTCVTGV